MKIPDQFDDTTPLRVDIAAQIAFPGGSMEAVGPRKERDAGRLETEPIAGKEYVTLAAITRHLVGLLSSRRSGIVEFA